MGEPILEEEIRAYVEKRIREGFATDPEIVTDAIERFSEEHDPGEVRRLAKNLVGDASEAQRRREAEWERPTDCDRLENAFRALEKQRIVSRHDFS